MIKSSTLLAIAVLVSCMSLQAQQSDPYDVKFLKKGYGEIDPVFQSNLRDAAPWSAFKTAHSGWMVQFDEDNQLPSRAFGAGIMAEGTDAESRAMNFMTGELAAFNLPIEELEVQTITDNGKHHQVFFKQMHNGLELLFSQAMVKIKYTGQVISWSAVVHPNITLNTEPAISPVAASAAAMSNVSAATAAVVSLELKILPIPENREYIQHLVYEVIFEATWDNGMPARYQTYVDAHTGEVLYRTNQIHSCSTSTCTHEHGEKGEAKPPVTVNANFSGEHLIYDPSEPTVNSVFANMDVIINGTEYVTDENGDITTNASGPVTATVRLRGNYARVVPYNNQPTPEATVELNEGENTISLDGLFTEEQVSGFLNVTVIHDYMKGYIPTFTGMDFELPVNIGISPHDCNAFYNGSSINFYTGSFDCVSLVLVSDVVFHEYGHGINDNFYQDQGASFNNGGIGEGYADVWGYMPYQDPVLGDGNDPTAPDAFIRTYAENPKVYPADLTGEVHDNGEIIAGAWWDTYLLLNEDEDLLMDLFVGCYYGLQATVSNGNEGTAFLNVLIDALEYDDDDANILNGTPNGAAISEGFAIHGITFLATAELNHAAITELEGNAPILIETYLDFSAQFVNYLDGVYLYYKLNDETAWNEIAMTDNGSNNYSANIPSQPVGNIVAYYMAVKDIFSNYSAVTPTASHLATHPNLPNYILVGYELLETYDSDEEDYISEFYAGVPSDNATTGLWEETSPVGSFSATGVAVAVDQQYTEDGESCFVTGNSFSPTDGIGTNDVDAGTTTLITDLIDLTEYANPAFTYMRWYTNSPPSGANPGADWWQVQLSDDGGFSWVYLEDSKSSDATWRRKAFRISDYVELTDQFMMKFNASDSLRPGQNLNGGSLVEAGLDDFKIYEMSDPNGLEDMIIEESITLYPNPTSDEINISFMIQGTRNIVTRIYDAKGSIVSEKKHGRLNGMFNFNESLREQAKGVYQLEVIIGADSFKRSFGKD
jgi:Zn-dependent metalloprotease